VTAVQQVGCERQIRPERVRIIRHANAARAQDADEAADAANCDGFSAWLERESDTSAPRRGFSRIRTRPPSTSADSSVQVSLRTAGGVAKAAVYGTR